MMQIIKKTTAKIALLAMLVFHSAGLACGLRLSEPKSHFDGVDALGHVSLIEKLGQLDAGKSKLPVFLIFNSGNPRISPYVGASFDIPLLSSRMEAVDENTFKFYEPDGWYQTFWRDPKDPTILNGGSGWKAEIKGDTIFAWADCGGSKATFTKGKITALEINGVKLDYVYNGNQVSEIRSSGAPVLKVLTDVNTAEVTGLSFGMNKNVSFSQDQKPKVQNIAGKNLVSAVERSLSQVTFSSGTKRNFAFSVDKQLQPTLKVDDKREITWNPETLKVIRDGDWTYEVKPVPGNFDNAQIARTNALGKNESWLHDGAKGEEVTVELDGSSFKRNWFTSGKLYGRPRSVTKTKDGKDTLLNSWSYDENGRLIRSFVLMNSPHNFEYVYNQLGQLTNTNVDGKEWLRMKYDDSGRLSEKIVSGKIKKVFEYTSDGVKETITNGSGKVTVRQLDKAFRLISDISNASEPAASIQ